MRRRRSSARRRRLRLQTRSTGSPVRGSNTWEYHLPPICSPRCERPLVATERFFTSMNMRGSLDSESAQGATMPIVRVNGTADAKVTAQVQKQPAGALVLVESGVAGPTDDVSLGNSVQADRAVRDALCFSCGQIELPGRRSHDRFDLGKLFGIGPPVFWRSAARAASRPRCAGRMPLRSVRSKCHTIAALRIARLRWRLSPAGVLASVKARSRGRIR